MNHQDIIVEAVPNFSEGRRPEVVEAIVQAIQVPNLLLLNYSSDWDHNRSVVTVAGPPDAVIEGLFQAIRVASQEIDLFQQVGEHPRLGAADVIPLVPIQNITLSECVTLAQRLGQRIGDELQLPVYLYAAAATRPEHKKLANVRKGQFERLVHEITMPHRKPDFGPTQVGSAGAVILGARPFLIAYNVYLQTDKLDIAKAISKKIRESSGGFPAVMAMGVMVEGQAQVSMNFVDFRQTSIHVVMDEIATLATAYGTAIDRSELIGLMPQQAILDAASHYLRLPGLVPERIVEHSIHLASQG